MTAAEIRASPLWKAKVQKRLKPLGKMTEEEKRAFAEVMERRLPKRP
jgi:hypothetical protein